LQELSQAGLPAWEVLRTATWYPAQYYKLQQQFGSVEEGKRADLILLADNPVRSVSNISKIKGVFVEGVYLDEGKLTGIEQQVHWRSQSLFLSARLLWDMMVYITL
jgi:imidazolonepropionase-like amidohydrolase